jgi:hypothetical protein
MSNLASPRAAESSEPASSRSGRWFAVWLPVLGLAALAARGEFLQHAGPRFRLPIAGYDPRDLISGHYLNYRYELDWQGESSCGPLSEGRPTLLDASCCVCLTRDGASGVAARQLACGAPQRCDGWLRSSELVPPRRYHVPEERAADLHAAFGRHRASVEVVAGPGGTPAVGELLLDGLPWRQVLDRR